jgi:hypothetical protein
LRLRWRFDYGLYNAVNGARGEVPNATANAAGWATAHKNKSPEVNRRDTEKEKGGVSKRPRRFQKADSGSATGDWQLRLHVRCSTIATTRKAVLISIPVLRKNTGTMCILYMRGNNYSTVGVNEQKDMVNSGVRGTKDKNLRSRCIGKLL